MQLTRVDVTVGLGGLEAADGRHGGGLRHPQHEAAAAGGEADTGEGGHCRVVESENWRNLVITCANVSAEQKLSSRNTSPFLNAIVEKWWSKIEVVPKMPRFKNSNDRKLIKEVFLINFVNKNKHSFFEDE